MNVKRSFVLVMLSSFAACGRTEDTQSDGAGAVGSLAGGRTGVGGGFIEGGAKVTTGGAFVTDGGFSNTHGGSGAVGSGGEGHGGSGSGGATTDGGKTSGGSVGEGGGYGREVALSESSWEAFALFTITSNATFGPVACKRSDFTVHFTPQAATLDAVLGQNGYVAKGSFAYFGATPAYVLQGHLGVPSNGGCTLSSLSISELSFGAYDDNADGVADLITGIGKATGIYIQGDVGETIQLSFSFGGTPDTRRPSFVPATGLHPLDGILLSASEPVVASSSVSLSNASGSIALTGSQSEGAIGAFTSAAILPFGASFNVNASGTDLAGLPFASNLAAVTTMADPGIFAQDGFESAPKATLTNGAKLVSAVGSLAALSGSQSLFIPPSSSATFHLARASGASTVRFSVQGLSASNGATAFPPTVQAGVIGGSTRVSPSVSYGTATIATGDSEWGFAAAKQEASVALSESGSDVIVRIQVPSCNGLCPPSQAVLIDDLRIE